jgi:hypothetical protein
MVILIVALHAGLALTFKVMFFSYYIVEEIGPKSEMKDDIIRMALRF